jgi:hypothetical protein
MAESEKRTAQLEARMAMLEKEVADLNQAYIRVINKLNQIPSAILLGPENPSPGWIAKLRPKE